ncbi:MAG: hypothetical protein Pg6B_04410 [Candidatus Azobacteroides pseudotrichonymphae]|nr:MAG: hypothetical protein Pg6B_04410 [Candidatus Azobacteroides pseudotrichonymphae]
MQFKEELIYWNIIYVSLLVVIFLLPLVIIEIILDFPEHIKKFKRLKLKPGLMFKKLRLILIQLKIERLENKELKLINQINKFKIKNKKGGTNNETL